MTQEPEESDLESSMTVPRVVLIEDHALVRAGLRTALIAVGIEVIGESSDGLGALDLIEQTQPDVAVIDIGLPGLDGIALTRRLKERHVRLRVVVLTMQDREEHVFAALAAGADAYCVKASDPTTVIDAIRAIARGGAYFDPRVAQCVLRRIVTPATVTDESPLSPRETEILRLVAEGFANLEIAESLHLGLGTVKGHLVHILEKLGASDRANAAVMAYRKGFLR